MSRHSRDEERLADMFDRDLFNLADRAARYAERFGVDAWNEVASKLFAARTPVRMRMSERDRKATS